MGKRRFRGRGHGHGPASKRKRNDELSTGQKRHLKEFGEFHPADSRDTVKNYAKVEEKEAELFESPSSSSESEEDTPYKQLLKLVGATEAAEEETSDDDDDDEDSVDPKKDPDDSGGEETGNNVLEEPVTSQSLTDDSSDRTDLDTAGTEDDIAGRNGAKMKKKKEPVTPRNDAGAKDIDSDSEEDDEDERENGNNSRSTKTRNRMKSEEEEVEDNEVLCDGEEEAEHQLKEDDPFSIHFEKDLPEELVERLSATNTWQNEDIKVKSVGAARLLWKESSLVPKTKAMEKDLKKIGVKYKLVDQVAATNIKECGVSLEMPGDVLTPLQHGLFDIMNKYQDLLYPRESHKNMEEIRLTYCLHAVNHVLKTRSRVVAHNTRLRDRAQTADSADVEYRDQGLTRPKVLVVVPTRHGAFRVVSLIISLLSASDQGMVSKRKRFKSEYGDEGHDDDKKGLKPEDFDVTFAGNTDEHFRIGLSVSKKSIRLYSPFYMADIIIASPLGLRTIIGAPGDKNRDYDFLSSIEVLILDQTEFFIMQNWDHILHIFEHLHLQPRESHGVDFSRTRMWMLNGWAKHYRQTLIFSSLLMPEITAIFNKHCHNFAGKVQVHRKATAGSVCQIAVQLPQMFHRIECTNFADLQETRFQFFLKEVLPLHKERDMKQTLIFVPSYFDFIRIRNYFKKEAISFTHINEYASSKGIRRARIEFKRRKAQFMLYTERIHFYRRFKLRGPKHIIFYDLPQYPHFYSEMCNMLEDPGRITAISTDMLTCTVIYSRFDALKLGEVVGTSRAERMINTEKTVHMLVSGDTS